MTLDVEKSRPILTSKAAHWKGLPSYEECTIRTGRQVVIL